MLTPAQIKPKSFESRRNSFFTRDGCVSCLRACLGARLLPQSYQYPNLSQGADRVGGQLCGDKECPFSDVNKSGRVWRKVPESGARSVYMRLTYLMLAWRTLQPLRTGPHTFFTSFKSSLEFQLLKLSNRLCDFTVNAKRSVYWSDVLHSRCKILSVIF